VEVEEEEGVLVEEGGLAASTPPVQLIITQHASAKTLPVATG
jgi:hypothetical protein